MDENKDLDNYVDDAIMERPYGFSIKDQRFYFYPVTLGKMFLLRKQIAALEINQGNLILNVTLEALRLAKEKKDECLTIICYHTCKTHEEIFDAVLISERKRFFEEELAEDDIAALMIVILTFDKSTAIFEHLGITKEQERMSAAMRVKKDKNTIVFGGKTQFGLFIDAACERYGWTKQYVVWGIDYLSLRAMLADKINTVYFSDEELKKLPASVRNANEEVIKQSKENMGRILEMDWK